MTKIIGIANTCKECPHRHYYSAGTHECLKVAGPEYLAADGSIPSWCPLPDYAPAASPAAPSVEQDERGAFEAAFRRNFEFPEHADQATFRKGWEAGIMQARAASTSANVAQGAEAVALALTENQIAKIAHYCETESRACPGTNMWMCAHMAVEETLRTLAETYSHLQIAGVFEDADGHKHIEAVIEDLDDLPKGMKLYASPQSEGWRKDAERYRWLVKNCFDWAAPGDGDSFDNIELHFEHDMLSRDDDSVGAAIDAEIAREAGSR